MVSETTVLLATWSVIVVPFVLIAAYFWQQNTLNRRFVVVYWTLPIVLTFLGILPAPWGL